MSTDVIGKRPYINIGGERRLYLDTLDMTGLTLEQLARSLAHENRFGGQTPRPYSVLEHSLLVEYIYTSTVRDLGEQPLDRVRLALLMHDAHEGLVKDMPSPLKKLLPDYRDLESRVELAVHEHFGITRLMDQAADTIKHYDLRACNTERFVFGFEPESDDADWPPTSEFPPLPDQDFQHFIAYSTPAVPGLDRLRFMQYVWVRLVAQLLHGRV
jgi:hypothetical protein